MASHALNKAVKVCQILGILVAIIGVIAGVIAWAVQAVEAQQFDLQRQQLFLDNALERFTRETQNVARDTQDKLDQSARETRKIIKDTNAASTDLFNSRLIDLDKKYNERLIKRDEELGKLIGDHKITSEQLKAFYEQQREMNNAILAAIRKLSEKKNEKESTDTTTQSTK